MQRFLHVGRSSSANVVNSLQRDAVILFFGTTACSSLIAATTSVLLGVFVFDFHWFAVLESFGEIWVKHDATRRGLVIAQCLATESKIEACGSGTKVSLIVAPYMIRICSVE